MSCDRTAAWQQLAAVLACAAALGGCADVSRGGPSAGAGGMGGGAGSDAATADTMGALSFATEVYPLLATACAKCHAAGQAAGDTQLLFAGTAATDYPAVVRFVDTSSPAGSRILAKMRGSGHQGGTVYALGSPEYLTVLRWIEQGASEK
jgi:hypothetical protein